MKNQLYDLVVKGQGHSNLILKCDPHHVLMIYIHTKHDHTCPEDKKILQKTSRMIKINFLTLRVKVTSVTSFLYFTLCHVLILMQGSIHEKKNLHESIRINAYKPENYL